VGLFSFLAKKKTVPEKSKSRSSSNTRSHSPNTRSGRHSEFPPSVLAQNKVEAAIDRIQKEMDSDERARPKTPPPKKPTAVQTSAPEARTPAIPSTAAHTPTAPNNPISPIKQEKDQSSPNTLFPSTVPFDAMGMDTNFGHTDFIRHNHNAAEIVSVPLLEEAAILFASGQSLIAEHMLRDSIDDKSLGASEQLAWFMLFDLYQIANNQAEFESLSIDYAEKFETSPPNWRTATDNQTTDAAVSALTTISFMSKLNAESAKLTERMQAAVKEQQKLRLDFTRVKEVDIAGSSLLLNALSDVKKSGQAIAMLGAKNLTEAIRATIETGRRDDTAPSWLLLLEILQLQNLEASFEEVSIDYCVTFEVSPPSFEAPKNPLGNALDDIKIDEDFIDSFTMPKVIDGNPDLLTKQIAEFAKDHSTIVLDCVHLERVEFGASAQLLNSLVPIAGKKDTSIQFHDVNYLVLMLFQAMGLKNVATIYPRKH
jgi:ABC-type transporter Mla MlaB component